jgi:LCP family protein required for cell wall assembly
MDSDDEYGHGRPPRPRSRLTRRGKVAVWTAGVCASLLAVGAVGAVVVYEKLNGNIHSSDITSKLGTARPVDLHPDAENIAVIGSDSRAGTAGKYGSGLVTAQSDTLMIMHVAASRKWATVVSIPRDSWVPIASCDEGNGQMSGAHDFKINEAFTDGSLHGDAASGAACTIKTVEQDTHVRIDHFVVVNFEGFKDMVDALGGVEVCTTTPINDTKANLHMTAGKHVIKNEEALAYVRARYSIGDGSDIGRIGRQQAFLSSLATKAKGELYNPIAMYRFLNAATKSLTTDKGLGSLSALYSLASSVKNMSTNQLTFVTLPNVPRSTVVPSDLANVVWKQPDADAVFASLRDDTPISAIGKPQPAASAAAVAVAPSKVHLRVMNGTGRNGLAHRVAGTLADDGFKVGGTGTGTATAHTVITYGTGQEQAAKTLAGRIPGAALTPTTGTGITLLLGSDFTGVKAATGSTGGTPQPAPSITARPASQNICNN